MTDERLIVKEAISRSTEYLRKKGSTSPRLDAEILLSHVLEITRLDLYLSFDRPLSIEEKDRYRDLLKRRAAHEPVAYITGEKEFMSLSFRVNPSVLIPRPDTETLVEACIGRITEWREGHKERLPSVFEVGIGSGAVSISLLHHFPELEITASDLSASALELARGNAARHGVADRLHLLEGDLLAGHSEPVDFLLSNPPYIAEKERGILSPDILEYEPPEALFAGKEGLDVIERLLSEGEKIISPGGWILVEIGKGQYITLESKIRKSGLFRTVDAVEDYSGVVRVLSVQK